MSSGARFQGVRTLGKGAYGFVQLAYDHVHDEHVAIKYIPRGETSSFYKYVLREVLYHQQLSLCKHPHIVGFYEVFLTPRYLGVVMEYIDGQDLQAYLVKAGGRLSEDVGRFVFQQLVVAVDFIHKKGKVNRDIKLANVLVVDSGQLPLVKLCDFGFSKDKFDDSAPQTQIGTALFTAPEVFLNVQGHVYEGEAVDVWSCGVVLHMLLFGRHPFLAEADMSLSQADQMVRLIENTVKGKLQLPESAVNMPAADMLSRILVPSPKERYSIQDIIGHPWFTSKLPPGALELNNAYLPVCGYQDARQTPDVIKQIIKSAIQVIGPDGLPVQAMPAASAVSSMDWPDSPGVGQPQVQSERLQAQHSFQEALASGAVITSEVPSHPGRHKSYSGMGENRAATQQMSFQQPQHMQTSAATGQASQPWPGQASTPISAMHTEPTPTPAVGFPAPGNDSDLQRMMQMLDNSTGIHNQGTTDSHASLNPDPDVEALLNMDMDTSGNILFDSALLKDLDFAHGTFNPNES